MRLLTKVKITLLVVALFLLPEQSDQNISLPQEYNALAPSQLELAWQRVFQGRFADWIESQGILYLLNGDGQLTALRSKDGESQWVTNTTTKDSTLAIAGNILALADSSSGVVVSIDSADGRILWRTRIVEFSPCGATQITGGNSTIFVGCDDKVYAMDARTGDLKWVRQLPNGRLDQSWIAVSGSTSRSYASMAYNQGSLYLRVRTTSDHPNSYQQEARVLALDALTGEKRWSFYFYYFPTPEIGSDSIATPFLFGDRYLFFITWDNVLFAISRETGRGYVKLGKRYGDTSPDRIPYTHDGMVALGDNVKIWDSDGTFQLIKPWWLGIETYPKSYLSFVAPSWRHRQGVAIQPGDPPVLWQSVITADSQELVITSVDVLSGEQLAQYTLKTGFEESEVMYEFMYEPSYLMVSEDMLVLIVKGKKTLLAFHIPNTSDKFEFK